jgi:hypothetical protein
VLCFMTPEMGPLYYGLVRIRIVSLPDREGSDPLPRQGYITEILADSKGKLSDQILGSKAKHNWSKRQNTTNGLNFLLKFNHGRVGGIPTACLRV